MKDTTAALSLSVMAWVMPVTPRPVMTELRREERPDSMTFPILERMPVPLPVELPEVRPGMESVGSGSAEVMALPIPPMTLESTDTRETTADDSAGMIPNGSNGSKGFRISSFAGEVISEVCVIVTVGIASSLFPRAVEAAASEVVVSVVDDAGENSSSPVPRFVVLN